MTRRLRRTALWAACLGVVLSPVALPLVWADHDQSAPAGDNRPAANKANGPAEPAGHSMHGDAFDEGPRQAAYLMGNTGRVKFPVTTANAEAQKFFEQGVGQLHGFWYFEAERSFRQVAALDPDCAMAYWGMAMANAGNEKRAKEFSKKAVERKAKASAREVLWIDGLDAFLNGGEKDEAKRRRAHIRSLEAIVHEYPDDLEAKAFLAWRIWDSRATVPIGSLQAVDALLDQVFAAEPMHPAHHYRIHLWDDEKPIRALGSAARLGQTAPSIAHMWHMPGHTFSKLKRYEDAVFAQEASARVDHAHMIRDRVMPYQIHNYAHNNEWCVRDLVNVGRASDAADLARNLIELPRHPKLNAPEKANSATAMGRERLIDVLTRHEMWDDYLAVADTVFLADASETVEQKVRRLRWEGVAYAAKGEKAKAEEQIKAIEGLRKTVAAAATQPTTSPATNPATKPSAEPTSRPALAGGRGRGGRGGPGGGNTPSASSVDKAIAHVRGELATAAGDFKAALASYEKAGDLPKDVLARANLAAGNKDAAEKLAREAVDAAKEQTLPLAVQVDVLFRLGKESEAADAFGRLRKLSGRIDLAAPPYARLAPVAQKLGYGADWRLARPLPTDVLPRPDLDALGPLCWTPSPAPGFSLATADGKRVSLADYRGKPVVVVFYLGHGCPHCIEQLNAFAPMTAEFERAGIAIVAVSTDSPGGLSKSMDLAKADGGFPFPLVSDEKLAAFKAFRAYDDFEKAPLHGTFLIDGKGNVRWQDVSFDPFVDGKFLLKESVRLLAQPG